MLFPLERLLRNHREPLTVRADDRLSQAMDLMLKHDLRQIPVVDAQGYLKGMVSEKTITRMYYVQRASVSFLDLTVDHCMEAVKPMDPEDDISDALDRFRDTSAIIVVKNGKPYRVFTLSDATWFFREISEGLVWVNDIEVTLRGYTDFLFDTEKKQVAAMMQVFGADKRDPQKPSRAYDHLSLGDQIRLLTNQDVWPKLEGKLEPKRLFEELLNQVREIRNQLAHFRGDLDPVQRATLAEARRWISTRPKLGVSNEPIPLHPAILDARSSPRSAEDGKYRALEAYLQESAETSSALLLTYSEIERLIGEDLPPSARNHRSWWANDPDTHPQAAAWARAGWTVDDVNQTAGTVLFRRSTGASYQAFYADLVERFKQVRPGLTQSTRTSTASWWDFSGGRTGFAYAWAFGQGGILRAELYIDLSNGQSKLAFDRLLAQREQIEADFGGPLHWDRLPTKKACRIYASHPGSIKDSVDKLEQLKVWAVDAMARLNDATRGRVRELPLGQAEIDLGAGQ